MIKFSFSRFLYLSRRTFADSFTNNKTDLNESPGNIGNKNMKQDEKENQSMFSGLGDKFKDIK